MGADNEVSRREDAKASKRHGEAASAVDGTEPGAVGDAVSGPGGVAAGLYPVTTIVLYPFGLVSWYGQANGEQVNTLQHCDPSVALWQLFFAVLSGRRFSKTSLI